MKRLELLTVAGDSILQIVRTVYNRTPNQRAKLKKGMERTK